MHVFRNALQIMGKVRNALKSVDNLWRPIAAGAKRNITNCPTMTGRLIRWSNEILLPYLIKCFWWMASGAITQANFISKLRRDLLAILSSDDTVALLSNVSNEDEFLSSLGIVAGLDRLRRRQMSRAEYVKKYGHRGPHEVEMFIPRPAKIRTGSISRWLVSNMPRWMWTPCCASSTPAMKSHCKICEKPPREILIRFWKGCRKPPASPACAKRDDLKSSVPFGSRVSLSYARPAVRIRRGCVFLEYKELLRLLRRQNDFSDQIVPAKQPMKNSLRCRNIRRSSWDASIPSPGR